MTTLCRRLVLLSVIDALALLALSSAVLAQDQPPAPGPTAEHELLKKDLGTWDATVRFWPQPDAEPLESKGVEQNELLPGGLWRVSHFEGDFGGAKFVGVGTFGYDPVEKKYVGTWIDNMSPHLMIVKSDYDAATNILTGTGQSRDPATGKPGTSKHVSRYPDDKTRTFEIQMPGDDGQYWKVMEIQYTRRAE